MLDIARPLELQNGADNGTVCSCVDITVEVVGRCVGENKRGLGFHLSVVLS
jgi:hypothetical protein